MKKKPILLPTLAVIALGSALAGVSTAMPVGQELINKAHKIEGYAAELNIEFRRHYAHLSAYRHLVSDLSQICAQAEHIHELAHDPRGSLRHLQADIKKLDELAHHLHQVVDASERSARGHLHGKTGHVHELLDALNKTIHRFELTVARISGPACVTPSRGRYAPAHFNPRVVRAQVAGNFSNKHSGHTHRR